MGMKLLVVPLLLTSLSLEAMSLNEVVEKTLQNNNTLKKVLLEGKRLKEEKDAKKSQRYGSVNLMASYDHYNNARTLAPLTPMDIVGSADGAYKIPATKDMFSTGVAYNVVLFDGFRQKNSYEISKLAQDASLLKTNLSKEELVYNVRSLYLSALALQHQLKAQKEYTAAQIKLYNSIEEAYKLGAKSKIDLLKAKNAYIQSRSSEEVIASNIEILKATLTQLMGGTSLDTLDDITVETVSQTSHLDADIENLAKYKSVLYQNKIAQKKYETVTAAYYPMVDFSAYYGVNLGPNATTNTHPVTQITYIDKNEFNSEDVWQVGIHLKWNLFDFGVKSAQSEAEKLKVNETKIDMAEMKLELEKNLSVAHEKLAAAISQYNGSLSQYELLKEVVAVETLKYETNAITLSELLDSRAKMRLAQGKMLQAKYEIQKAKYYTEYLLEQGVEK